MNYAAQYAHLYEQETASHRYDVVQAYTTGDLRGWNEQQADQQRAALGYEVRPFEIINPIRSAPSPKRMLYDITRKILSKDTPNYPQQIGDCTSFGMKNALEYIQCTEILNGNRGIWKPIFPPYLYGAARVLIDHQHSHSDGSTGAAMAAAATKYGGLFADAQGVPAYSGSVAKSWGYSGPPQEFITVGQQHLLQSAVLIRTWDDLVNALDNGYAAPTASNVGYQMEANPQDGFHHRAGSWSHQMCFIGYGTVPEPYAIILNNWGDVHGHLTDFDDKTIQLPVGVLRVRQRDAMAHINAGETYACSQYQMLIGQDLDKALFKFIGN